MNAHSPDRRQFLAGLPLLLAAPTVLGASGAADPQRPELRPLYRLRFGYTDAWEIPLGSSGSAESQGFFLAEGECEGRVRGRFRGANHPRRRADGTYEPDFQGIIETADGAVVYFDYRGYGRTYPAGRRQIVSSAIHMSGDERYRWLNDVVCVGTGEVRSTPGRPVELVLEVLELLWREPAQ